MPLHERFGFGCDVEVLVQTGIGLAALGHTMLEQQPAYGEANYRRLVEVKTRYDPENVFRSNKNIPPTRLP